MNVLVACEESQRVCIAFRERCHNAFSCDIIECSGGHPEWHIQGDAKDACRSRKWDLIIVHPPCTRLCNSGQRWLYWGDAEYQAKKRKEQIEAVMFFMWFVNFAEITGTPMAIENPMGIMSNLYRKPDFTYNPYDFQGETECKKTGIWTFNGLPELKPTQNLPKEQRTQGIWRGHFEINGEKRSWHGTILCVLKCVALRLRAWQKQWQNNGDKSRNGQLARPARFAPCS